MGRALGIVSAHVSPAAAEAFAVGAGCIATPKPTHTRTCPGPHLPGACVRMLTTFLVMSGFGYSAKEKLFYAVAWTPKATVQAALSGACAAQAVLWRTIGSSCLRGSWHQAEERCMAAAACVCSMLPLHGSCTGRTRPACAGFAATLQIADLQVAEVHAVPSSHALISACLVPGPQPPRWRWQKSTSVATPPASSALNTRDGAMTSWCGGSRRSESPCCNTDCGTAAATGAAAAVATYSQPCPVHVPCAVVHQHRSFRNDQLNTTPSSRPLQVTGVFTILVCGTLGSLAIPLVAPRLLQPARDDAAAGEDSESTREAEVEEDMDKQVGVGGWERTAAAEARERHQTRLVVQGCMEGGWFGRPACSVVGAVDGATLLPGEVASRVHGCALPSLPHRAPRFLPMLQLSERALKQREPSVRELFGRAARRSQASLPRTV